MVSRPELSLVIPIYNEEEVLPQLDVRLKELIDRLAVEVEVVFVNDGSKDRSIDLLRDMAAREPRYKVLGFSRNFGHQRAITAGMDKSRGRAIVVIDADLQDPPEVILEMVDKWREGYDVVYGRRRSRVGESWFKLMTAKIFYRSFAALIPIDVPLDTGDFRLMSRRVVTTMRGLRETHRFVRGLVAWVGFKQTAVEYDRAARAAGETKYPLRKMLAFAIDGIASFSIQPLRLATYVGALVGTASVLYGIVAIISNYAGLTVPGWTTTVVLVSFLFSVQFFMIGVLGEYIGRIYEQVKRRPLYIVAERINFGRRREKLVTQDLEVFESPVKAPPPLPNASVPPPPVALTAALAATEAKVKQSVPPMATGRDPTTAPAKAGAAKTVTASTPPPPKAGASVPPPRVAPAAQKGPPGPKPGASVPPPKGASVPPPRPGASVPPPKGQSAPPPPITRPERADPALLAKDEAKPGSPEDVPDTAKSATGAPGKLPAAREASKKAPEGDD